VKENHGWQIFLLLFFCRRESEGREDDIVEKKKEAKAFPVRTRYRPDPLTALEGKEEKRI